jgi:hypothetical protein
MHCTVRAAPFGDVPVRIDDPHDGPIIERPLGLASVF